MPKLGTRCLPKFLVEKIGKDAIMQALRKPKPDFPDVPNVPIDLDIRLHRVQLIKPQTGTTMRHPSGADCVSGNKSKKLWRERQLGVSEPVERYSLNEALERAGL